TRKRKRAKVFFMAGRLVQGPRSCKRKKWGTNERGEAAFLFRLRLQRAGAGEAVRDAGARRRGHLPDGRKGGTAARGRHRAFRLRRRGTVCRRGGGARRNHASPDFCAARREGRSRSGGASRSADAACPEDRMGGLPFH